MKTETVDSKWVSASTDYELEALMDMAHTARAAGAKDMEHMDAAAGAYNSIRVANLVSSYLQSRPSHVPILDWGCGYGQITWLLERRGLPVASCDVEERPARASIPLLSPLNIQQIYDCVRLPYDSESFGTVLSVGVLEHVPDLGGSLLEVNRILRPGGLFFIFMFPNRFSWAEFFADLRHISVHPRKYTLRQTRRILSEHGFAIDRKWRRNFLPRNLTGFSLELKRFYGRYYRQIESLDKVLANLPPTSFFSGVLEVIARKCQ